ncbi:MAG: thioredoxin domain-containing protein [Candidatus Sumerlaeaceae bacterium]
MSITRHSQSDEPRFTNRLANETSLYLRQHAHQPVDWYPWGNEALERARRENKPVFISIGYSACHWCHVMAHESFDNEEIAFFLNQHFVSIKVDREEHPDVDAVYMNVCMALNVSGGWPLTVFTTPSLHPIFAGTYFPPTDRGGRIGFRTLLERILRLWQSDPQALQQQALTMTRELQRLLAHEPSLAPVTAAPRELLIAAAEENFDSQHGGFGHAPKFPPDTLLSALLAAGTKYRDTRALNMVEFTLDAMMHGGLYDQLEGGFARYCVDEDWTVPHFEKMLYNQALLIPLYADASVVFERADFLDVARETAEWVLCKMQSPEGGFYSALDADSEGEEGKYYVWTSEELTEVLGPELAEFATTYFEIPRGGNFERGSSVLRRARHPQHLAARFGLTPEMAAQRIQDIRSRLRTARERRIPPATDDKVILAWNALMVSGLLRLAQVSGIPRYAEVAQTTVRYLWDRLRPAKGKLYRILAVKEAKIPAILEDYAYLIQAMLDLYEYTLLPEYLALARELAEEAVNKFVEPQRGRIYSALPGDSSLILPLENIHDSALPSPAISLVKSLLRLDLITATDEWAHVRHLALSRIRKVFRLSPLSAATAYLVAELDSCPIVCTFSGNLLAPQLREIHSVLMQNYLPTRIVRVAHTESQDMSAPTSADSFVVSGASLKICLGDRCLEPIYSAAHLKALMGNELLAST